MWKLENTLAYTSPTCVYKPARHTRHPQAPKRIYQDHDHILIKTKQLLLFFHMLPYILLYIAMKQTNKLRFHTSLAVSKLVRILYSLSSWYIKKTDCPSK